jgi:hypothetical protein
MRKFLKALLFWIRRKNPEREWYRRQEESIRDGIIRDTPRDPD